MSLPIDPSLTTALMAVGGTVGVPLTLKLLGKTADYLGDELQQLTQKRLQNIQNIFGSAERKLGDRINEEGDVPPKVLRGVLDEGSFNDDFLVQEYFGGVLASSRSGVSRDDRGATFIAQLNRMSTYHIRAHYVFYSIIRSLYLGEGHALQVEAGRNQAMTFVPWGVFHIAMGFENEELDLLDSLCGYTMRGLQDESLITPDGWAIGTQDDILKLWNDVPGDGLIFIPSASGVELYLWANGKSNVTVNNFLNPEEIFELEEGVTIPTGSLKTR